MADASLLNQMPPPGVDPAQYLQTMRRAQLAQALMGQALSPAQTPNGGSVGGMTVTPRVSPLAPLAKLASALMARKQMDQANQGLAGIMGQMGNTFAPGGQMQPTGQTVGVENTAQATPPDQQGTPGPTRQVPTYQQTPPNPMNPDGLPPQAMARLYMTDPAKYLDTIKGTPEWQNALRAAGGDPGQAMALLHAQQVKAGTTEARPGGWVQGPNGQWTQLPQGGPGQHLSFDGQGNIVSSTIPGYNQQAGALKGIETAAEQANTPRLIPTGGGAEVLGYAPTPPALRQGQPPAPGAPQQPAGPPANAPPQRPAPPQQPAGGIWSTVPKLQIPNTPGQSSNVYTETVLKDAAAKKADLDTQIGQSTDLANQQLQFNRQAAAALPNAEVGPLSGWLTHNRNMLQELGVPGALVPGSGTITPTLELNKYLTNAALQGARQLYGARMTQNEVKLQTEQMSPSATMTRDAVSSLINQSNIQANYQLQRGQDYQRYLAQGGDPTKFENWYNQTRPLPQFAAMQSMDPAKRQIALQRFQQNPQSRQEFISKLGWDPVAWQ